MLSQTLITESQLITYLVTALGMLGSVIGVLYWNEKRQQKDMKETLEANHAQAIAHWKACEDDREILHKEIRVLAAEFATIKGKINGKA